MPAAAVIPAPVAYTNIVAVKKLVVRCRVEAVGQLLIKSANHSSLLIDKAILRCRA